MKQKIKILKKKSKVLFFIGLLFGLFIIFPNSVFADIEDFTSFTEVDTVNDRIQVSSNHIDFDAYRHEITYLYKDYGVDYFNDFVHYLDAKSTFDHVFGICPIWCLGNNIETCFSAYSNNHNMIWLYFYRDASGNYAKLIETSGGSNNEDASFNTASSSTWYYFRIEKSGTSLKCRIWTSSSDRNNNDIGAGSYVTELSVTLNSDYNFRYLYSANTWNSGVDYNIQADIENLDLGVTVDNSPEYSLVQDNNVTQVGESVTVSCYWMDDYELNTSIVCHNSTGIYVNSTVSVSGSESWSNKTFTLNYTSAVKVGYLFYAQDNASHWNSTSTSYITTTKLSIMFNLTVGGEFHVNGVSRSNGTLLNFNYNESINLIAVPLNSSYVFKVFNGSVLDSDINPTYFYSYGNDTIWCYFLDGVITDYTGYVEENYFVLVFVLAIGSITFIIVINDKKRKS